MMHGQQNVKTLTICCPVRIFSEDLRFTTRVSAVVFIRCRRLSVRIHTLSCLHLHRQHRFTRTVLSIILTSVLTHILIKTQLDATAHSLIYSTAKSLYMFRVPTAPIIRSAKNCNRSLRYRS